MIRSNRHLFPTFASLAAILLLPALAGCPVEPADPSICPCGADQFVGDITVEQAHSIIEANTDNAAFSILDVRTPTEFAGGHLQNAINIDVNSDTFRDDVGQLETCNEYLVYCAAGGRSAQAVSIMEELGFIKVYNMTGGITAWIDAGYPTTTNGTQ